MSRTEMHVGTARLVPKEREDQTLEEQMLSISTSREANKFDPQLWYDVEEWFNNVLYKEFIVHENQIYKLENKELEEEFAFEAIQNKDGSISYILFFYNGSCSFEEALSDALKDLKSKKDEF